MELTQQNYFSAEANKEYMSVSQFKNFENCQAKALHDIEFPINESKPAFVEGHLFEALVTGVGEDFYQKHPEIISSKGCSMGKPKAAFQKVINAANFFKSQKFFMNIINRCDKQVILIGEIEGVKVKCALDLFDRKTNSIYDIKCMKDYKPSWDSENKTHIPWYNEYGYALQLAIYSEIVRQNFGEPKEVGLISATKEEVPDIQAISFSNEYLNFYLNYFKSKVKLYNEIKEGKKEPIRCENCDYCKATKEIKDFTKIK